MLFEIVVFIEEIVTKWEEFTYNPIPIPMKDLPVHITQLESA